MWKYSYDGESWTHDDLTGAEIVAIEKQLKVNYTELQPGVSMTHKLAVFASFLTRSRSEADVVKIVADLTLPQIETEVAIWVSDDQADLPTEFEDGLPSPEAAPTGT